jgi:arabinofuranan 3-O-arabinosyltransferase
VAIRGWWATAIAVLVLLLLLGGPAPLIALLGCLLLRRFWSGALPVVLAAGVLAASAVAVAGRLLGHGQDWAFGPWAQVAVLVAVSAAVASFLYPSADPDDPVAEAPAGPDVAP